MPPTVNKVTTQQTIPPQTPGLLNRIIPVKEVTKGGLKMSLYGRPKTGKTRLAATFPKPLLILGTEDGTESVKNVDGLFFLRVIGNKSNPDKMGLIDDENFIRLDDVLPITRELAGSKYKTIILDTATNLQDLVYADTMGLEDQPLAKTKPPEELLGVYANRTKALLREILRIPRNVVIISHEKDHTDDKSKKMQNSELLSPLVSSSLSGSVCRWVGGEVDYLCQTFVREKVEQKSQTVLGKEQIIEVATGRAEYCLRIGQHAVYSTGFRFHSSDPNYVLPDVIVNPTYDKICNVIQGKPA